MNTEKNHRAMYLYPRSARMEYGLTLSRMLLDRIRGLVEDKNGQFFIFIASRADLGNVPNSQKSTQYKDIIAHRIGNKYYFSSKDQYIKNVEDMNDGFNFISVPVTVENPSVSETDPHLNCVANEQVMQDLAAKIAGFRRQ